MANPPPKRVSVTYQMLLSRRYRHLNMQPPPLLKEKELVLVSNSSDSLKVYQRKPQGSDESLNKSTYPKLLGIDGAKALATELHIKATSALTSPTS